MTQITMANRLGQQNGDSMRDVSPVEMTMRELEVAIEILNGNVISLVGRIAPVLRPSPPAAAANGGMPGNPHAGYSPMYEVANRLRMHVEAINGVVCEARDRLEV